MMRMPFTRNGLRRYDHLEPVEAVLEAWTNPGNNPEAHLYAMEQVRSAMPLLARALDRLSHHHKEEK